VDSLGTHSYHSIAKKSDSHPFEIPPFIVVKLWLLFEKLVRRIESLVPKSIVKTCRRLKHVKPAEILGRNLVEIGANFSRRDRDVGSAAMLVAQRGPPGWP
jgi:hypothetical protein